MNQNTRNKRTSNLASRLWGLDKGSLQVTYSFHSTCSQHFLSLFNITAANNKCKWEQAWCSFAWHVLQKRMQEYASPSSRTCFILPPDKSRKVWCLRHYSAEIASLGHQFSARFALLKSYSFDSSPQVIKCWKTLQFENQMQNVKISWAGLTIEQKCT